MSEPDQPARASLWTRAFILAWIANFLHSTGFHAYLHWPGWLEQRGADEVKIGLLFATLSIAAILARPFIGRLMDTRGRRVVTLSGGIIHVCATALYLWTDTLAGVPWGALILVRVVHGVAEAALFSVLFTIAADIVPAERRAEGLAIFGVSGLVPLGLGGILGDVVIVAGDFAPLFWITGGCALLGLLASLPLPETRRGGPSRSFLAAARAPELRSLWFVGTCFAVGLAAYFVFLKTYLITYPEIGSMSLFFSVYVAAAVFLRVGFGWMPERYGLIRVLSPALFIGCFGIAVLAVATGPAHLVIAGVACGTSHAFAFPILSALVVTRAQPDERGSAVALFTALFDLGVLVGGPSFGAGARFIGYRPTYAIAAAFVGVATVVFIVWDRRTRRVHLGES